MSGHDLELEKALLLSLATKLGFDEDSAKKCLDQFVSLYGDDGKDFITVEYCGDDFLAALADFDQGTEEWDDMQAMESEAQGTLAEMFVQSAPNIDGFETEDGDDSRVEVHVIDDSPEPKKKPEVMELDSSSDWEDDDTEFRVSGRSQTGSRNHSLRSMKTSAYISQQDLHIAEMTVWETIDFSARCQGVGTRTDIMMEVTKREKDGGIDLSFCLHLQDLSVCHLRWIAEV